MKTFLMMILALLFSVVSYAQDSMAVGVKNDQYTRFLFAEYEIVSEGVMLMSGIEFSAPFRYNISSFCTVNVHYRDIYINVGKFENSKYYGLGMFIPTIEADSLNYRVEYFPRVSVFCGLTNSKSKFEIGLKTFSSSVSDSNNYDYNVNIYSIYFSIKMSFPLRQEKYLHVTER